MSEGPLQVIVVSFPGLSPDASVVESLSHVESSSEIALRDLAFVAKNEAGELMFDELSAFENLGEVGSSVAARLAEGSSLLTEDDLAQAAEILEPATYAVVALVQHLWAARVGEWVTERGGEVLATALVPAPEEA